ncbi:MAG: TlpA family protein disulfide reductase [Oscillospiraceae bacterium]|nr:TlpA family protein disulfide reductase [Oscillospiraceae bacterium]
MKNKRILLILVLVFALLIGGASVLYSRLSNTVKSDQLAQTEDAPAAENTEEAEEKEPIIAPDFTVYDLAGKEVHLSDYRGKPVVLNFWASWCGPCKMEMPHFEEKSKELAGEVQFLMVNVTDGGRETVETASAFIAGEGYTFPVFYDTAYSASSAYGAYSLPTTIFINAEGHAIAQAVGAIDSATLQKGIDMIK